MKTTIKTLKKHAKNPDLLHEGFNGGESIVYSHADQFEETFAHKLINIGTCYILKNGKRYIVQV